MPDPLVFVDGPLGVPGAVHPLSDDDARHLRRVLRLDDGAAVVVSDGGGQLAPGVLRGADVELTAPGERAAPRPGPAIEVVHALPKGSKLDEVIRTLTELGIRRIVPIVADRSVRVLEGDRAAKQLARWQGIARSAAAQSRRADLPEIVDVSSLDEVLADGPPGLVAHVGADVGLGAAIASGVTDPLVLAIGPEGGWSREEIERFEAAGWTAVNLGATVLRTEHAAVVLAAAASYATGAF